MHYIYIVCGVESFRGAAPRYTQTCTRDAPLAHSRMHVALSRSPFIASNKAQPRVGLFYTAVS